MKESLVSVEAHAVIARPVEEVFAFASEQTNEPTWHTDIVEVRPAPGASGGGGFGEQVARNSRLHGTQRVRGGSNGLGANRLVEFTTRSGPLRPTTPYRFDPASGGTLFRRHVDIPLRGRFRIMKPVMARVARRRNARFVENLKHLLEHQHD